MLYRLCHSGLYLLWFAKKKDDDSNCLHNYCYNCIPTKYHCNNILDTIILMDQDAQAKKRRTKTISSP